MSLEVLAEERGAGEVQRVGDFLNGHVGGFQFGFYVDDDDMRNDVQHVFPGHQFDGGAEVLQGYAQLFGIELRTAFGGVVFDNQLYELTADFLFPAFNPVLGVRTVAV